MPSGLAEWSSFITLGAGRCTFDGQLPRFVNGGESSVFFAFSDCAMGNGYAFRSSAHMAID